MTSGARQALARAALLALPIAFLAVFFAWPVTSIIDLGLRPDGTWDLTAVREVLGDGGLRQVLWFTVWQAALSTLLTLAVALPAAQVLTRYQFRGRSLVRALVPVPFVLPTVVVGAAFLALLGPRSPFGVDLDETVWAILLAHIFFNLAVVVRIVGGMWEGLDPSTEEAARTLGATRWRAFTMVTLPALRPAIVSAASIVFLFTFTSFGVVQILGGPGQATLEVEIYRQTADLLDLRVAAVLSLIQLTTVGALLVVQDRLDRRRVGLRLRPVAPRRPHGTGEWVWVAANLALLALLLGAPLATLVERSFRVGDGHGLGAWEALGERTQETGLFVPAADAVATSLKFAAVATLIAVVLGTLAASGLARLARSPRTARRRWSVDPAGNVRGDGRFRLPDHARLASPRSAEQTDPRSACPGRGRAPLRCAHGAAGPAIGRPSHARGCCSAGRLAAPGLARGRPAFGRPRGARRGRIRLRHLAR